MNNFYIVVNEEQKGPFSLTELKEMGILKSTLIWKEGMDTWVEAGMLEELNNIWKSSPPPIPIIKKKVEESNINVTFGFKTNNKQKPEKKEKKPLSENEKLQIVKNNKINFNLLLASIVISIISLPIIALKDFKAQSLKQKWDKIKYDEKSGDMYVENLKKEIESRVDKEAFFRFSDSAELFKEYNPYDHDIPILGAVNGVVDPDLREILNRTNYNRKKQRVKVDHHRTASENAEYYWKGKAFDFFDYDKFVNSTRDTALINRWDSKFQSEEFKKQEEFNSLKYEISGLLTPEEEDANGSVVGGVCNQFYPIDPIGSGLSVRRYDYDCILRHYGDILKSENIQSIFVVLLVSFTVSLIGRYIHIISKKSNVA